MSDGFKKIKVVEYQVKNNKIPKKTPVNRKLFAGILLGFFIVMIIIGGMVFFSLRDLYYSTQQASKMALEAYASVKAKDLESTRDKLVTTEKAFLDVENNLKKVYWMSYLPFIGEYVRDGQHGITAAIAGIQAAEISTETLVPYADLLGLKGKSSFVEGTADERIRLAVETLDKIIPGLDKIADKIAIVNQELKQIEVDKYPTKIGSFTVREKLKSSKDLALQTSTLFVEAKPLFRKIPELLGIKNKKRYLVIFQNDAELRATGGFITAYAVFNVDKGKLSVEKSDDIYKLDEAKKKKFTAPAPILKYHQGVNYLELRDSNLSPDYMLSMQTFEKMLSESVSDFPEFDGIISLDTHVLVSAIKILGEFNVYGRSFSADLDKRCNCAKAIYELEDYATKPVAYVREERKDIISALLFQIMQRALGVSPSKYWGQLTQVFMDEATQKHILFYFHDEDSQKGVESLNVAGRIQDYKGDYLHISDVNFAGAKSNLFVKKSVKYDLKSESDGSLTATLTINYKNPSPGSNCNLEAGQLCLNGILRNWLRIYTSPGAKLLDFVGSEKATETYEELGKTVFEGFHTVKPEGVAEVIVKYQLPGKVLKGETYHLLIQKQPGTDAENYSIIINGREIEKVQLLTDKEITFKI